jgi:hypothetical protein
MKILTMTALAAALVLAVPVFAEEAHHPDGSASTAKVAKPAASKTDVDESLKKIDTTMMAMHAMHEKMMAAKTPEERNALMADHMKAMQDGMSMMGGMGANGKDKMKGRMPSDPVARQKMMEKRMDMMESMMQMMMDRMPAAPAK